MTTDSDLPEDVLDAIRRRHKIAAIKRLRRHRKLGLKEARDSIEDYLARHPDLVVRDTARAESGLGRLILVGLLIALAYGVYHWLSGA